MAYTLNQVNPLSSLANVIGQRGKAEFEANLQRENALRQAAQEQALGLLGTALMSSQMYGEPQFVQESMRNLENAGVELPPGYHKREERPRYVEGKRGLFGREERPTPSPSQEVHPNAQEPAIEPGVWDRGGERPRGLAEMLSSHGGTLPGNVSPQEFLMMNMPGGLGQVAKQQALNKLALQQERDISGVRNFENAVKSAETTAAQAEAQIMRIQDAMSTLSHSKIGPTELAGIASHLPLDLARNMLTGADEAQLRYQLENILQSTAQGEGQFADQVRRLQRTFPDLTMNKETVARILNTTAKAAIWNALYADGLVAARENAQAEGRNLGPRDIAEVRHELQKLFSENSFEDLFKK